MTANTERDVPEGGSAVRPYVPPRIVRYGSMRDLTRGGHGSKVEGGATITKRPG
jgi:hypothetical protein